VTAADLVRAVERAAARHRGRRARRGTGGDRHAAAPLAAAGRRRDHTREEDRTQ